MVKGLNLFQAQTWPAPAPGPTVALAGDAPEALDRIAHLVRDLGATPAVLGGLRRARHLEEVGGFVIGLAFAGLSPATAVPC